MSDFSRDQFNQVLPVCYAEKLRDDFIKNPEMWYSAITPRKVADELKNQTNNDFSLVWHMHCEICYKTIDKDSDVSYVSDDDMTWLCKDCYDKLFNQ